MLEFFGDFFSGILISDFYAAYNLLGAFYKQKCLSHLFTEIKKCLLKEEGNQSLRIFCKQLKKILKDAIKLRVEYDNKKISKIVFDRRIEKLEKRLDKLIQRRPGKINKTVNRLSKRLKKYRSDIFTFLYFDGINPTNNAAERAVRPIALMRKISFGSNSEKGVKTRYILMSLIETCKILNIDFISFAKFCINEDLYGREVPGVHEYKRLIENDANPIHIAS